MINTDQREKLRNKKISLAFTDGSTQVIPTRYIHRLQMMVLGLDFSEYDRENCKVDIEGQELEQTFLGKLSEQSDIIRNEVYRSIDMSGWNYADHPDPELILFN